MPVFEVKEISKEIQTNELKAHHLYYYKNSIRIREIYDERYYDGIDQNFLMEVILENFMHDENVRSAVIGFAKTYSYLKSMVDSSKSKYTSWWFITLTSKPEWSEELAKVKLDRYRESHFKLYKNMIWVEEHGTESEKYHQHILVDSSCRFHTGINLKPTQYYDANINIKRVTDTHRSKEDVLAYLQKENKPQGNLQYFGLS